jgi:hypothetical protein
MSTDLKAPEEPTAIVPLASEITAARKRPLLVLFWPNNGSIQDRNIEHLHLALTSEGKLSREQPLEAMDVLIHTLGGEPTTAYRLAQLIRDYAKEVTFLVPEYAYSGGTLMCLAAKPIALGDYAVLSPIDITLVRRRPDEDDESEKEAFPGEVPTETEVELVAIDYFIQVAKNARIEIEREFRKRHWSRSTTTVESDLLCEMTRQLGVLRVAKYYREKNVTQEYARELLRNRMFGGIPSDDRIERILRRLVLEAPAHEFALDYNICLEIGLDVERMSEALAKTTRLLSQLLTRLAHGKKICPIVGRSPIPFFQLFAYMAAPISGVDKGGKKSKEVKSGDGTGIPEPSAKPRIG